MNKVLIFSLMALTFSLKCDEHQDWKKIIVDELVLAFEGARDDAREIMADAHESMQPITNEFTLLLNDIKSDYSDFAQQAHHWYSATHDHIIKKFAAITTYIGLNKNE